MSHVPPVHKVLMLIDNRPAPADARVWPEACALCDHGLQVSIIFVLLDNRELRRMMRLLERMRVEEKLRWEHSKEHLLVAYGTLLSSAQSRHVRAASAQVHQQDRSVA